MITEMTLTPLQVSVLHQLYTRASVYCQGLGPQALPYSDVLCSLIMCDLVIEIEGLYDVTPDGEQVLADNLYLGALAGAMFQGD